MPERLMVRARPGRTPDALTIDRAGQRTAVAYDDGSALVYDAAGRVLVEIHDCYARHERAVALALRDDRLAILVVGIVEKARLGGLVIFDLGAAREVLRTPAFEVSEGPTMAFSRDGRDVLVRTGTGQTLRVTNEGLARDPGTDETIAADVAGRLGGALGGITEVMSKYMDEGAYEGPNRGRVAEGLSRALDPAVSDPIDAIVDEPSWELRKSHVTVAKALDKSLAAAMRVVREAGARWPRATKKRVDAYIRSIEVDPHAFAGGGQEEPIPELTDAAPYLMDETHHFATALFERPSEAIDALPPPEKIGLSHDNDLLRYDSIDEYRAAAAKHAQRPGVWVDSLLALDDGAIAVYGGSDATFPVLRWRRDDGPPERIADLAFSPHRLVLRSDRVIAIGWDGVAVIDLAGGVDGPLPSGCIEQRPGRVVAVWPDGERVILRDPGGQFSAVELPSLRSRGVRIPAGVADEGMLMPLEDGHLLRQTLTSARKPKSILRTVDSKTGRERDEIPLWAPIIVPLTGGRFLFCPEQRRGGWAIRSARGGEEQAWEPELPEGSEDLGRVLCVGPWLLRARRDRAGIYFDVYDRAELRPRGSVPGFDATGVDGSGDLAWGIFYPYGAIRTAAPNHLVVWDLAKLRVATRPAWAMRAASIGQSTVAYAALGGPVRFARRADLFQD